MSKEIEIIYVRPRQFEYLIRIYTKKGHPLPGDYVTGVLDKATYIVNYPIDIGRKTLQTYFRHLSYYPITFFPGETIFADPNGVYFCKEDNKNNCAGVDVVYGRDLPEIVPENYVVQKEILPLLHNNVKFDMRVLCCIRRDGYIYFYKNIFYRFSTREYTGSAEKIEQLSIPIHLNPYVKEHGLKFKNFFEYDQRGRMNYKNYVSQLQWKLKEIYASILPHANSLTTGDLSKFFMIIGMDFIPDSNDDLCLLELNSISGWDTRNGIHNYRHFYDEVTKFILGKTINSHFGEILSIY